MKRLFAVILLLACFASVWACPGSGAAAGVGSRPVTRVGSDSATGPGRGAVAGTVEVRNGNSVAEAGVVRLRFENLVGGMEERDSMLIIFDRYDHTGAGVVRQVCAAGSDQSVTLMGVPAGKYFVTIQCIGLHRDRMEKIVTVRSHSAASVRIRLTPAEAYAKSAVVIPVFHPDVCDLAVVKFRNGN
jgi:hypothetical protein